MKEALTSYSEVAESERYDWPLSSFVRGVLAKFDLPDCHRLLTAKGLRMIDVDKRGPSSAEGANA